MKTPKSLVITSSTGKRSRVKQFRLRGGYVEIFKGELVELGKRHGFQPSECWVSVTVEGQLQPLKGFFK